MDRHGFRQVPEGSGEQGKMEETGCKIICGTPTTLTVIELRDTSDEREKSRGKIVHSDLRQTEYCIS